MSIAICVYTDGDVMGGFIGPFKVTPTGIQLQLLALFYDVATRRKETAVVTTDIPDGSTLAQLAQLCANKVKAVGAEYGFTVGSVLLPSVTNVTPQ